MKRSLTQLVVIFILFSVYSSFLTAEQDETPTNNNPNKFLVIPLGVEDSVDESNLTAYLLASIDTNDFICLDAGTLWSGLRIAVNANSFPEIAESKGTHDSLEGLILREHIKAYLISHAHFSRVAGLVINSPIDNKKPIVGLTQTIDGIKKYLFNWYIWPNVGDSGVSPYLSKYYYVETLPKKRLRITGTDLYIQAFPLNHGTFSESTAFLIQAGESFILYLGDTEPDRDQTDKPQLMKDLWVEIAPLIKKGSLRGLFISVPRPNNQAAKNLENQLTPNGLMDSLRQLAKLVDEKDPKSALKALTIVIKNIQPNLTAETPPREQVKTQLELQNDLGVRFVFPVQGHRLEF